MTTTFEEAWFVNYLSNQTNINLTKISLGYISSLKTSLKVNVYIFWKWKRKVWIISRKKNLMPPNFDPFKKFLRTSSKFILRMSNFREFPRKRTWGTFCRYLARDKISTFHILTCLPFCNLINLILYLYLRFFFLFEFTFLFLFLCTWSGIWSTIKISTFYILTCLPFAISSISQWWWWSEKSFLW